MIKKITLSDVLLAQAIAKKPKASKYKNVRTSVDGINFSSKLEASYYRHLLNLKANGTVNYFLRQVPIHLPANIRYVVDFLVVYSDNHIDYVDTKGVETDIFKLKKKQVESLYPIKITIVKKVDHWSFNKC